MKLSEAEHVLRAASEVTQEKEFVCIGSQAILAQFPDAPRELRVSIELDIYPRYKPEKADLIDGSLGEQSQFHLTHRYYAHGVSPTTAVLPPGWENRLIKLTSPNTNGAVGWCLEVHDLAFSKLAAGREKDIEFVAGLIDHHLATRNRLNERIVSTPDTDLQLLLQQRMLMAETRLKAITAARQTPRAPRISL
jgi:hypothetical protein